MVQCHYSKCRMRKSVYQALYHDGKYFCDMACLNLNLQQGSTKKEEKPSYMSQSFFDFRERNFGDNQL